MRTTDRAPAGQPGRPTRLVGLDIARGLAVIGMIAAHAAVISYTDPNTFSTVPFSLRDPRTWTDIVNGRSSTLFAVLAGVSVALVSGGRRPDRGIELVQDRLRLMVRAALIFALGGLLELLNPPLGVILPVYGILFAIAIGFLTWSSRALFVLAGALTLTMPIVQLVLEQLVRHQESRGGVGPGQDVFPHLLVAGAYPVTTFVIYLVVGLGIGRMDLTEASVRFRLLLIGAGVTIAGYGIGSVVHSVAGYDETLSGGAHDPRERALIVDGLDEGSVPPVIWDLKTLLTASPHTGSWFDIVGSSGVAVLVIALCLLIPSCLRRLFYPIAAVGAMALTSYTIQVVALSFRGDAEVGEPSNAFFFTLTGAVIVVATIWRMTLGTGPLERAITRTSKAAAHIVPGTRMALTATGGIPTDAP